MGTAFGPSAHAKIGNTPTVSGSSTNPATFTGSFVELGARPDGELADLDGRVVEASGHLYVPAATEDKAMAARSPLPTFTDISSVQAAAG